MLLSITMGMTKHSHHHHLTVIFLPIYTGFAEENNETTHTTTKISLAPLQNIKDELKAHMSKHHRLGDANTNSGYYNY